ncbi:MAG: lipid A deacylase LpxR family protein [Marinovum sp.]|nr:lipid A deacylase LpxR family protein [Marinovum sp.]
MRPYLCAALWCAALLGQFLVVSSLSAEPASSAETTDKQAFARIGYGRLVTNDLIGDGRDRWQTGGYSATYAWGRGPWTDGPRSFDDSFEVRFDAALMSPENLRTPKPGDRPMTGLVRFGLASQYTLGEVETELRATLSFAGPDTALVDLQTGIHDSLPSAKSPSKDVRDAQLDLDPRFGVGAEFGRSLSIGRAAVRPFVEFESGYEVWARAGFDMILGSFGRGGLQARDMVTGHRYRVVPGAGEGLSLVFGGDVTEVFATDLLREEDGVDALDTRHRLRAGVHWQRAGHNLFYGVSYLSPETEYQDGEGQTVGALRLDWNF